MSMLVTVTLPYESGLPQDVAVNTFAIGGSIADADGTDIAIAVSNFWLSNGGSADPALGSYIGHHVERADDACRIEVADINLATGALSPQVEIGRFTMTPNPIGTGDLPLEVALCTSVSTSAAGGDQSTKGRWYLGPFNTTALDDGFTRGLPATELVNQLAFSTFLLAQALDAAGHRLQVWSRKNGTALDVVRGWVDNEFDTQRRREINASSRTSWTAPF